MVTKDLTRTLLAILFIVALGGASLLVLSPFVPALVWAIMIVIATWPLMLRLQSRLRNSRALAATVMVSLLLMILVVPLMLLIGSLVQHADDIAGLPAKLTTMQLPLPPDWVAAIPLVGAPIAEKWRALSSSGLGAIAQQLSPHAGGLARWVVAQMGNLGMVLVNFLLVAVLAAILYLHGETAGQAVIRFARRLSGARGEASAILAAQAVRAVAMGIVLTALVQTMVGWLGLLLAGIPYIGLLTVTMFILALAQLGAGLVILCSALWLFWSGAPGWGIFMIVWSIIVGGLDNVLRPMLIKRGADLPLLLIFAGVIGGLLTLGIIGLFIGPLVLAVTYTLVAGWIEDGEAGAGPATATDQAPDA